MFTIGRVQNRLRGEQDDPSSKQKPQAWVQARALSQQLSRKPVSNETEEKKPTNKAGKPNASRILHKDTPQGAAPVLQESTERFCI
jgi:hypothetical protein